jgi:hypothetical protein
VRRKIPSPYRDWNPDHPARKPSAIPLSYPGSSLVPILSQMNPVHTFPPYLSKISSNIIFPSMHKSFVQNELMNITGRKRRKAAKSENENRVLKIKGKIKVIVLEGRMKLKAEGVGEKL